MRGAAPLLGVAREGWPLLLLLLLLAAVLLKAGVWWLALPPLAAAAGGALFFRERADVPAAAPDGVLAPVSGAVVSVRKLVRSPIGDPATRVRIRVSLSRDYGLRAPIDGLVRELPRRLPQPLPRGISRLQTARGEDFLLVPRRGVFGSGSLISVPVGQRVGQARRIGARRAVRVVDLYLPTTVRLRAVPGAVVEAGRSVLGTRS